MHEYNASISAEKRDYNKQWYQEHKEQAKAKSRQYRHDNPEKTNAASARWRADNKEYRDTYNMAYFAENQPRLSQKARERRKTFFAEDPKAAWLHYITGTAVGRARKNKLPYDRDLSKLALPDICPVLGTALNYSRNYKRETSLIGPQPDSPSLDRIVPEHGYVFTNLRVISWRANFLKRDATIDEIKRVLAYMEECSSALVNGHFRLGGIVQNDVQDIEALAAIVRQEPDRTDHTTKGDSA
jgi:hypothetical protein